MTLKKCVFLDRDGVINEERGTYTYKIEDFAIISGVAEAIGLLKSHDYKIIVITNQSGISQGLYTREMMEECHRKMMQETFHQIDDIYYSKWHPDVSDSLFRKPDSLMLERAIASHHISASDSWLVGDSERDILAAKKVDLKTILVGKKEATTSADFREKDLISAVKNIILLNHPE